MGGKMHGDAEMDDLRRQLEQRDEEVRACRARIRTLEERLDGTALRPAGPDRDLDERVGREADQNREMDHLLILRSRQAAMGELIGNIAHQWRQPLTAISLLIQDLKECYEYGEFSREYLDKNVGDALGIIRDMSLTLNDYRDFFSVDNESSLFGVRESLERAVAVIESSLRCHNVTVTIEADDGLTASGRPNEFSQAILHIIGIVRESLSGREAMEPTIRIRAFREGSRTVVSITGNGGPTGVPVDPTRRDYHFPCTPEKLLDLSLARTIIEKGMGGRLTVDNPQGCACFRVEI